MELSIRLIAVSIGAIWVLRWAWKLVDWVYLRPTKVERLLRKQGLKGTSYKLLFGDIKDFVQLKDAASSKPMEFSNDFISYLDPLLHRSVKSHGENSFLWIGPIPLLTVTQPHLLKEVFARVNDFHTTTSSLLKIVAPGIVSLNDEKWAKHRKLINPAFHMQNLKLMMPIFVTSCNEMMNEWEKMVSKSGSVDLDTLPQFSKMTRDVIAKATFSTSYEQGLLTFELVDEQIQIYARNIKYMFIPGWRYVPTSENKRFNELEKQVRNLTKGIIDKRRIEMERGGAIKNDLLCFLMRKTLNESQAELTMEELIDECKIFNIAGKETITTLLAYTMILLGRYSNWQTKAREEVLKAYGKGTPDFDGLCKLKTVTMILYEVLRLYPSTPETWRKVVRDTKLGDWCLPKGTHLKLPIVYSHHNPRHWGDDAGEFNPNRFSQGISEATEEKFAFIPFASGPRVCVGQNFAMIEVKIALAMILQRFLIKPSPSYSHSPCVFFLMKPKFGAHVILHQL